MGRVRVSVPVFFSIRSLLMGVKCEDVVAVQTQVRV